jgi:hypothetical protein
LATDRPTIDAIEKEIVDITEAYGLPPLRMTRQNGVLTLRP